VEVDRVGVFGEVVQLPDLGGPECRVLGQRLVEVQGDRAVAVDDAELGLDRSVEGERWPAR
jgi:hypothetical protein